MINLSSVSLKLNNKMILTNINLNINSGDRIGLVGPNGSGKTMLLRLLAGIYTDYSGTISKTEDFFFISTPGVGAHPNLQFLSNIKRILAYHNVDKINLTLLNKLIKDFELENYLNYEFKNLSQGYRIRVSLVSLLLMNLNNILADEFFGFGDKFVMAKFEEILNTKLIQANSLVIASHNQQLINKFCNRIIHLDKGSIIKDEQLNK
jgi:ABC-type polysaccharide/polyol phosphate transport system ATPase subunit